MVYWLWLQVPNQGHPVFNSRFIKFVFRISRGIKFWDPGWGFSHRQSEFNCHYDGILTCFSILILWNLCEKPMSGRQKALFYYFLSFGGTLIAGGWGACGVGQKVLFRASWNGIFSSWDFSRSNKHDIFWHVVSTGYFYVSWAIAVLDFRPLEIYKKLALPLSTFTFTVNSHADNHFYKYINLFQI